MKKVTVHGAYVGDNFGDTLLLALTCLELNRRGYEVFVSNACPVTINYLSSGGKVFMLNNKSQEKESVALVYGGGGYFGEQPVGRMKWNLRFIRLHLPIGFRFAVRKKVIGVCGVDFGPLSLWCSRFLAKLLLNRAVFIGARNAESCRFLSEIGVDKDQVSETADVALLLSKYRIPEIDNSIGYKSSKRRVLIHPSYSISSLLGGEEMAKAIKERICDIDDIEVCIIADRANKYVNSILLEWADYLGLPKSQVFSYCGPWETCALIRDSDAVITNKLHTAIVATAYGKNVISLAKHPKNLRFFNQISRPDLCLMLQKGYLSGFLNLLDALAEGSLRSAFAGDDVMEKAQQNFSLLDEVIGCVRS